MGEITKDSRCLENTDNFLLSYLLKNQKCNPLLFLPSLVQENENTDICQPLMFHKLTSSYPVDLKVLQFFHTYLDEVVCLSAEP